ncbi:hypothetical protein [Streptomyces sp. NPDC001286]
MDHVSYQVVRPYVAKRKPDFRVEAGRGPAQVFIEQSHLAGAEAEVDSGEVAVRLRGELVKCLLFCPRLSFSGKAVHRVFASGGQEALFESSRATSTLSECWAACPSARSGMTT